MAHATDRLAVWALGLAGAKSRWLDTPEGPVHRLEFRGRGDGPPVLLFHGLASSAADYAMLVRHLVPYTRRVVAVDLPGHGLTPAPRGGMRSGALTRALFDVLARVSDEPSLVFGNSLGGLVGIRWALARPDLVRGLVLASPAGAALAPHELDALHGRFRLDTVGDAFRFMGDVLGRPHPLRPFLALGTRSRFTRPAIRDILANARSDDMLGPADLGALRMPVAMVWGKGDRVLPRASLDWFRAHLPAHAQVEEPDGYGHAPFLDDPRGIARRIVEMGATVETRTLLRTA